MIRAAAIAAILLWAGVKGIGTGLLINPQISLNGDLLTLTTNARVSDVYVRWEMELTPLHQLPCADQAPSYQPWQVGPNGYQINLREMRPAMVRCLDSQSFPKVLHVRWRAQFWPFGTLRPIMRTFTITGP